MTEALEPLEAWQAALDAQTGALAAAKAGAAIAIVPRGVVDAPPGPMLVWRRTQTGVSASLATFSGFKNAGANVLFMAEDGSIGRLRAANDIWDEMRELITERDLFPFVLTPRDALAESGLAEFLETIGLPFMGACR